MDVTTYGLDVAKTVFQFYSFDAETGKVSNRKLAKQQLMATRQGLRHDFRGQARF